MNVELRVNDESQARWIVWVEALPAPGMTIAHDGFAYRVVDVLMLALDPAVWEAKELPSGPFARIVVRTGRRITPPPDAPHAAPAPPPGRRG